MADRMGTSESSVKRSMTRKKMTIGEFELYSKALNLNPYDVFLAAHDGIKHLDELTVEQEDFLCRNPTLDYIFLKLSFGFSPKSLMSELDLTADAFKKLLKKIERYELIKITRLNEIVLLKRTPFKWIKNGPLEKNFGVVFPTFLLKHFSDDIQGSIEKESVRAFEIYLKKETFFEFKEEQNRLIEKYRRKCRIEMSLERIEDLKPYSFLIASDQLDAWKAIVLARRKHYEKNLKHP